MEEEEIIRERKNLTLENFDLIKIARLCVSSTLLALHQKLLIPQLHSSFFG